MSGKNFSLPSEANRNLNKGSPSSILHSEDHNLEDSRGVEATVIVDSTSEKQEQDLSRYRLDFKPGYEYGLLVILVKVAETLQRKTMLSSWLKWHKDDVMSSLHTSSTAEDFAWARKVIEIVHGQHEKTPEMPTNVSHPCLDWIVTCLNTYRHTSLCNALQEGTSLEGSTPIPSNAESPKTLRENQGHLKNRDVAHRSTPPEAWWALDPQIWRTLVRYCHYAWSIPQPVYLVPKQGPKATSKLISQTFPLLASLKVTIHDFGESKHEHFTTTLALAQAVFVNKPRWARVRWIHVPIGASPLQKALENSFKRCPPTRYDRITKECKFDVLGVCPTSHSHDQLVTLSSYSDDEELSFYLDALNEAANDALMFESTVQNLTAPLHGPLSIELLSSLIPRQIGGNAYANIPNNGNIMARRKLAVEESRVMGGGNVTLFRDSFRAIRRDEEYVLTMSTISIFEEIRTKCMHSEFVMPKFGRDYESRDLADVCKNFTWRGDADPLSLTFLTFLVTEILKCPNMPTKYIHPRNLDLHSAYAPLVQELRSERSSSENAVNTVRKLIELIDEISQVHYIGEQKVNFLRKHREECDVLESEKEKDALEAGRIDSYRYMGNENGAYEDYPPLTYLPGKWWTAMIDRALEEIEEDNTKYANYLRDLKSNLDVVFQLATIEQNERALKTDMNNRAILIFTIVTIIFLPLSFFTSYFGMNLPGIVDTQRTEREFWAVCGTSTAIIVGFTVLFGFKERLHGEITG